MINEKTFTDFRFVLGYPQLDKFKDEASECQDLSELYSFKINRSGGTYSEDDTEQKLKDLRTKLTKEIYDYLVDNNTYIVTFDDAREQLIIGKSKQEVDELVNDYRINDVKDWDGYDVNSVDLFEKWFNQRDYINIDRNPYRIKEQISMKENKKISLEEATIKALYDSLPDDTEDVEGVVDDILVITDPEITSDEYDEVIEKAQEIIEDTPEGKIPFDEEYVGEYVQRCPRCGNAFVEKDVLEPGATCPICLEQPESFIVIGKIEATEDDAKDEETKEDTEIPDEEVDKVDSEEETNETNETNETEEPEKQVASKEVPQGNKLQEGKLEEEENKKYSTTYINNTIADIENLINEWTENLVKTKEQYDNETDEKEKEDLQEYMDMVARQLSDLEKDLIKWKNISKSNKNESINSDGFPNDEDLQKYFQGLDKLPETLELDGITYNMEQYGGSGDNSYVIYTDANNSDSYIKVFYTMNKIDDNHYQGVKEITGVSDLRENKSLTESEEETSFQEIVDMMMDAEDYSDLYAASELIIDEDLKDQVTTMITECEEDEDDVDTAASLVTTDLLDNLVMNGKLNESKKVEEALDMDVLVTDKVFQDLKEMEDYIEANNFDILDIDQRNEQVIVTDITSSDGMQEVYQYEEQPDSTFKIIRKVREEKM